MEESHVNVTIMISSLSRIHIFLNVIVGMSILPKFVASRQNIITKNPSQIQKYINKGSTPEIMHFILKGSGKGPECEHYAKYCFPSLGLRLQDDTNKSGYDHIHIPSKLRVEQKTAGNWDVEDNSWTWQHIEPKHNWHFLLLCGIGYREIHWFFLDRTKFNELCDKNIIKRQGDADRNSYQGWWFNYTNAKDDLIEITSNEHLDLLSKRIAPLKI